MFHLRCYSCNKSLQAVTDVNKHKLVLVRRGIVDTSIYLKPNLKKGDHLDRLVYS